jgi:radical SAM protein with 4Fe4S-binding SPASM domain
MDNFYCAAPWRGLHINPRGDVKTCCAGNPNMLGNLNSAKIEDVLNSPKLQEIRQTVARGQKHPYCSNCQSAEAMGGSSERSWHNNQNPQFDYTTAGDRYHYPVIMDVRWNTTCNLSCNYCSEWASSKWSALKSIPFKSGTRPYYDAVCDFVEQHREHIQEVALVGGEPLLLPENERLLDVIPENAIVTLITNMAVDFENNKVFRKIAQRRRVGWSMSFENIAQRYEYVRYGGDWQLLKHNLEIINDLKKNQGHWGGIHAVYNIYSATRLCELYQFAKETETSILWQKLFDPDCLDPFLHGPKVAQLAMAEIDRLVAMGLISNHEQNLFATSRQRFKEIQKPSVGIEAQFRQHISNIESKYHTNKAGQFEQLWPELAFLCK